MKRILCLLIALVMVFAITACGKKESQETEDATKAVDSNKKDTANNESLLSDNYVLNVLLVGKDADDRGDAIMLVSIDNTHKKLKLTSFQRDTYVVIPGHNDDKLNNVMSYEQDVSFLVSTIESNFLVKIDKYVEVGFDQFLKIIDILDGVDIELSTEEIKYINAQIDVNNQEGKTDFIDVDESVKSQVVHLNSYQALWYVRNRGAESLGGVADYTFEGDDWDRTARQRKLIKAVISGLEDATLDEMLEIVNAIGPNITTDLKEEDITFLVSNSLTYLTYEVEELAVPTMNTWSYGITPDGQSLIAVDDWEQLRKDFASFIYEEQVKN